jgi:phenylacetate-CoA ligase
VPRLAPSIVFGKLSVLANRLQHRAEVNRLIGAPWESAREMDALRVRRLANTVARAAERSTFYREVLGPNPIVPESIDALATLPITSKSDFRCSGLSRAVVARGLGRLGKRGTWGTSGSSGEPYTFEVDRGYSARHAAQRAFVYLRAGLRRGATVVEVLGGSRRPSHRDRAYSTFRRMYVGYAGEGLAEAVFAFQPQLLYGNLSHLLQLAEWVENTGYPTTSVDLVCSSSELMSPEDEATLERAFSAPVLDVFGSSEAGLIAFRLASESKWRVLEPRVIVEVLDENRRPVSAGEVGEIVITTLTEPTSPMIRYATGDLARVESGTGSGSAGLRLAAIEGRAVDSLVTADGKTLPYGPVAGSAIWATAAIARRVRQWQIHQRADRSIVVSLEPMPAATVDDLVPEIVQHLTAVVGSVPVTVVTSDRLRDAAVGKFRAITSDATS